MTLAEDLSRTIRQQLKDAPPIPSAFLTHPAVPYGRVFRQWDTKGWLWLWVHPDVLACLPRVRPESPRRWGDIAMPRFGIPVRRF